MRYAREGEAVGSDSLAAPTASTISRRCRTYQWWRVAQIHGMADGSSVVGAAGEPVLLAVLVGLVVLLTILMEAVLPETLVGLCFVRRRLTHTAFVLLAKPLSCALAVTALGVRLCPLLSLSIAHVALRRVSQQSRWQATCPDPVARSDIRTSEQAACDLGGNFP
jgi:hypothetical protein